MYEEQEEDGSFDFSSCQKEKKAVYKYRYGATPKQEDSIIKFDFEVVDFDHKALRKGNQILPSNDCIEENTLLLIKPTAMIYKEQIRTRIFEEGFVALKEKTVWLRKEIISDLYNEHYGKPWFPKFVMKMVAGPIHIMVLAKYNAIEELKELMGNKRVSQARRESPYSLRALYGLKGDSATNGVHGSKDRLSAAREIRIFFPQVIPEPIPEVPKYIDYINENMFNIILQGVMEVNKEKPLSPISWLGNWFLHNNPNAPLLEPDYLMKTLI